MQKNILLQLTIILCITYAGNLLAQLITLPLPGVILGFILMFLLLSMNIVKLHHVDQISKVLLTYMTFLFIPAGVALVNSLDLLAAYWWKLLIVILASTVITMVVTGWVVQYSIYYFQKRDLQQK